ncbi:zinc ribbon domain-containing protein [Limosilactobacillus fermentum]|uniref:zinc ribbon domain-containing protein n=1 Tax=Limosilactobacillus fermentum TaxID=1613 RepID=UPI0019519069|nr:zinc-ribbon domain-containing protein [Limosilactobacillus fermentum]BCQ31133.1 zinc ribbon domain-containing protein [Limosilactobacillus fermentum]
MASKFCPNCGHELKPGARFCPNCGYQLRTATEPAPGSASQAPESKVPEQRPTEVASANPVASTRSSQPSAAPQLTAPAAKQAADEAPTPARAQRRQRPQGKSRKPLWIGVGVAAVVLIGGYAVGSSYYSRQNQLNRAISALSSTKEDASPYLVSANTSLKVTKDNAKPLQRYFTGHASELSSLKQTLLTSDTYGNYRYVRSGSHWLIFPRYQISFEPAYAELMTNHEGVTVKMGGKQVATLSANDQSSRSYYSSFSNDAQTAYTHKVGPYVPGDYSFTASGTVSGHKITAKANATLTPGSTTTVDVGLSTLTFTVVGPSGATVYVGGDKAGTIGDSGSLELKDYPVSGNTSVYLTVNASGKTYESKHATIGKDLDYDNQIAPTFTGMISKDDADTLMKDVYSEALTVRDSTDDSTLADYFKDGASNEYYQQLIKMANGHSGNDSIDSYDYEARVNSVAPAGDNQTTVNYDVTYTFDFEDGSTKTQVFRYNGTIVKDGSDYKVVSLGDAKKVSEKTE